MKREQVDFPDSSADFYSTQFLEPFLRKAFDHAFTSGQETLLGEMMDVAVEDHDRDALRFLKRFEFAVSSNAFKADLDKKRCPRRYRIAQHMRY